MTQVILCILSEFLHVQDSSDHHGFFLYSLGIVVNLLSMFFLVLE